jgi:hypothetical protein
MKTEHGVGVLSEGAWVSSSGYFGFLYMFNGHVLFDHLNALLIDVFGGAAAGQPLGLLPRGHSWRTDLGTHLVSRVHRLMHAIILKLT